MRYAINFTPPAGDRLTYLAARWLGRNAFTDRAIEPTAAGSLTGADIAHFTATPRRFGFHASLKAPFELAEGASEAELLSAMMHFCGTVEPVVMPALRIERVGSCFVLTPVGDVSEIDALAATVLRTFDRFRATLSEEDIERRNPHSLTRRQLGNLYRWGCPHVCEDFRFHMMLTGAVDECDAERVHAVLREVFDPILHAPVVVGNVALFYEAMPGAPFVVHSLHPLGSVARRKSA